ncbi:SGNH/GDSL hydrolase family protein [bacterium]|nr:SGNH/GDSL hydrolase family protein [bacterium]
MLEKINKNITNICLSLFSLALTYFFLEFFMLRFLFPILPLQSHGSLNKGIKVLPQSSKQSTIPLDYIAIVGDSYAQGFGDWFLNVPKSSNDPFHSAHILNKLTEKDVITFGASGSGSLRGLVTEPISQFEFINSTISYSIDKPDFFLVYFYEGNDLNDNIQDIEQRFKPNYDINRIFEPSYFEKFIEEVVLGKDETYINSQSFGLYKNLFILDFGLNVIKEQVLQLRDKFKNDNSTNSNTEYQKKWKDGKVNEVFIKGNKVKIPDGLQSPALELSKEQIHLAIYVFEQSILYLNKYFKDVPIYIMYIPSPLSCYTISSDSVKIQTSTEAYDTFPSYFIKERSAFISKSIENIAQKNGFVFFDTRKDIQDLASERIIHGPLDWKHFNKEGYTCLAEIIIEKLKKEKFNR